MVVRSQEIGDRIAGDRSQEIGVRRLFLFILPTSPSPYTPHPTPHTPRLHPTFAEISTISNYQ
ncbi:MAG: hypothetical protein EWV58_11765 [Microcystis aeruginosa Ma_MB_F_20061100_S19]|nr:MAG: hypothetical protein EWV59_11990 [Microcystis aeruginosa Ma_MB_F_20061100_S19D]TRU14641.1 MAG: hypothetical protein EWV58_11765 [Microcystis aeruginosa Ma_MB_F_20061100_S19]